jgi:hypothetical protein
MAHRPRFGDAVPGPGPVASPSGGRDGRAVEDLGLGGHDEIHAVDLPGDRDGRRRVETMAGDGVGTAAPARSGEGPGVWRLGSPPYARLFGIVI